MAEKTIRSHRERVKQANLMIREDPFYKNERISIIDREAFVEFFLLEDIVALYKNRLKNEEAHRSTGRTDEKGRRLNIEKFSAIITVFNAAIGSARAAIQSGDYKKVWKAIHEGALMAAASSVKNLPELKKLAIELLKELSRDTLEAEEVSVALDEALDDLDAHEANVRQVKDLPSEAEIDEIIRAVEIAIPDEKSRKKSKLTPNLN